MDFINLSDARARRADERRMLAGKTRYYVKIKATCVDRAAKNFKTARMFKVDIQNRIHTALASANKHERITCFNTCERRS